MRALQGVISTPFTADGVSSQHAQRFGDWPRKLIAGAPLIPHTGIGDVVAWRGRNLATAHAFDLVFTGDDARFTSYARFGARFDWPARNERHLGLGDPAEDPLATRHPPASVAPLD